MLGPVRPRDAVSLSFSSSNVSRPVRQHKQQFTSQVENLFKGTVVNWLQRQQKVKMWFNSCSPCSIDMCQLVHLLNSSINLY